MLARIVYYAFNIYALGLIAYVVCSWISGPRIATFRTWLHRWYIPFLSPIRRLLKPIRLGEVYLDLSSMILLIAIYLLREVVVSLLILPF